MSSIDPRLADQLDRLVPSAPVDGDWNGIVRAAGRRTRRRRLAQVGALAAAFAVGVSPVGAAIADGVADFSAWLRGEPGSPASERAQQEFERGNSRSWAGFPQGTRLRSLMTASVGGHEFELFGFRSGSSLCLRLVAGELNAPPAISCAPLSALRSADAPVLVIEADHGFGQVDAPPDSDGHVPPEAQATFGIVADGVQAVELQADDGRHRARIASNAFLYIAEKPPLGTRVRSVVVLVDDGRRLAVPFEPAAFGESEPPSYGDGEATGPTLVEREVEGGRIGWIERQEKRGEDPPGPIGNNLLKRVEFSRALRPDPGSHMRVVVAIGEPARDPLDQFSGRALCTFVLADGAAGGGCSPMDQMFFWRPFTTGEMLLGGGDQYATLAGLASDDVARMVLFLSNGEREAIPLRDNAWLIQAARADYPLRIVAYDQAGQIIGVETFG